jgi:hypothetical protein
MAISRITASQFAAQIVAAIQSRNKSYDTTIGPIPDTVIQPLSNVLELQNERIRSVQQLVSLKNDGSFGDDDLDSIVFNESMVRLSGGQAAATLVFSRSTRPTADITVQANFPVATLADESTNVSVTFLTTQTSTLVAANSAQYFNSTTQRYELVVPAVATVGSSVGNVSANRIVRPLRPLNGFDNVFNRDAATGGQDRESNDELISRYFLSLVGSSPAVVNGIKRTLRDLFSSVSDVNLVYGNNPLNVRSATDGGAVDAYVIGTNSQTVTETVVFPGPEQVIPLSKQPVISILSIGSYIQGTDFVLAKDTSGYVGSVEASDGIRFVSTGSFPAVGTPISVTYTYNAVMLQLQDAFTSDDLKSPGQNILFKTATEVDTSLVAQIKVRPGYNVDQTLSTISAALMTFINSLKLGESVEMSDLQLIVRAFTAVDNFVITNLSAVGSTGNSDLSISANQYARLAAGDLVLTVN